MKKKESLTLSIGKGKLYPEILGATVWEHWVQFSCPAFLEEIPVDVFWGGSKVSEEIPRLLVFERDGQGGYSQIAEIPFPAANRFGDVYCMAVEGIEAEKHCYAYAQGDKIFCDPYARLVYGRERFGGQGHLNHPLLAGFASGDFDWEGDRPLNRPMSELMVYRLHVRGFTAHPSSGISGKGTFGGVRQKISYLGKLGVTAVELLPVTEFEEVEYTWKARPEGMDPGVSPGNIRLRSVLGSPSSMGWKIPTGRLNYWGYGPSYLFAPKYSYHEEGKGTGPDVGLKQLIKALHKKNIEVILELFFPEGLADGMMLDVLRYWVLEYHVDGIHISGRKPCQSAATDPVLAKTKLFAADWKMAAKGHSRHLAQYHDGFLVDMRRFLKGDEDSLSSALMRIRMNPEGEGVVNYMASTNGFSLADMVAYDQKHNEDNGEKNQDGTDYNYSWNCGVEGGTRRKQVLALRKGQMRNALVMLFLSQGIPLIEMGDEVSHTKKGNNNAFCQDNGLSWLHWRKNKAGEEIYRFICFLSAFRGRHGIFHMEGPLKGVDYQGRGCPDFSIHGENPWRPEFEAFRRQLGLLYCGDYAGELDNRFYVLYNMHWLGHIFSLPPLPRGRVWRMVIHTTKKDPWYYDEEKAPALENQGRLEVPPRTVVVLMSGKEI